MRALSEGLCLDEAIDDPEACEPVSVAIFDEEGRKAPLPELADGHIDAGPCRVGECPFALPARLEELVCGAGFALLHGLDERGEEAPQGGSLRQVDERVARHDKAEPFAVGEPLVEAVAGAPEEAGPEALVEARVMSEGLLEFACGGGAGLRECEGCRWWRESGRP